MEAKGKGEGRGRKGGKEGREEEGGGGRNVINLIANVKAIYFHNDKIIRNKHPNTAHQLASEGLSHSLPELCQDLLSTVGANKDMCVTTHRLHPVTDTHDQLVLLLHLVNKLHWDQTGIKRLAKVLSSCVQSPSKSVTLHWVRGGGVKMERENKSH